MYPIEVFDAGTSSAEGVRGYRSGFGNFAAGTSSGQLIAGNLQDVYKETIILAEEGYSDGALIEGDLYSNIKVYTTPEAGEAGESSGELIASAYLDNIFYTRFEDAGTSEGLLIGATLL